jgi:hypothetical protein
VCFDDNIIDRQGSSADATRIAAVVASDFRFSYFGTAAFAVRLLRLDQKLMDGIPMNPRRLSNMLNVEPELLQEFCGHLAQSVDLTFETTRNFRLFHCQNDAQSLCNFGTYCPAMNLVDSHNAILHVEFRSCLFFLWTKPSSRQWFTPDVPKVCYHHEGTTLNHSN